jgi:succinate dehydrogenase hydrophobic anchor subunit
LHLDILIFLFLFFLFFFLFFLFFFSKTTYQAGLVKCAGAGMVGALFGGAFVWARRHGYVGWKHIIPDE